MTLEDDRVIAESEAAHRLSLSPRTLIRLRRVGGGPKYVRMGIRRVGYRLSDLNAWVQSRTSGAPADEIEGSQIP